MKRMALLAAVFSSMFCLGQDPQVIPPVSPATVVVTPAKPVQATQHAADAVPPAAPVAQTAQNPCKPKPGRTTASKKKFPTGSGHEPI